MTNKTEKYYMESKKLKDSSYTDNWYIVDEDPYEPLSQSIGLSEYDYQEIVKNNSQY